MPTIEQIRKNKYAKLVEKFKEREEKKILEKNKEEKVEYILKRIFTPKAWERFDSLQKLDHDLYVKLGAVIIEEFGLYDFCDLIIRDILKGRQLIKFTEIDLEKYIRKIKGVRSKIQISRDGQITNLSEALKGKEETEESERLHEKGTSG